MPDREQVAGPWTAIMTVGLGMAAARCGNSPLIAGGAGFQALKYTTCDVVASRRPLGDHNWPIWSLKLL